LRIFPERLQLK